jgi:UDP-GlcNAc:undecaprenyl-phosphate GlcNAc-1-phosphate transferase
LFLILTLGAISFLLSLILTPIVRDRIGHLAFLDQPDGIRKKHLFAVPRVGGIAIALSYALTFALALALPFSYNYVLFSASSNILKLSLVAAVVFLTGVLDDAFALKASHKLIGISAAATLAYAAGIRVNVNLFGAASSWPWLSFALTVIWLIGCSNAFNLIDGMDGLAAGVGLFATLTMLLAALSQGNLPLALATMPLAGCLLGFLRYNFNPASVFLGDSGSLLIGFLLGCYGALWSEKSVTLVAMTVPILALSIPLADVALSIFRRFLRNRPIFVADRGHIHHKLLDRGHTTKGAVLVIYGLSGFAATASLLVGALHNRLSGLIVILFCVGVAIGVRYLKYGEFTLAGEMFLKGRFRKIVDTETRLLDFEAELSKAATVHETWAAILRGSKEFGFHGVRLSAAGMVFEDSKPITGPVWQLRIPLREAQYINFYRDFSSDVNAVILSAFVKAIERGLKSIAVEREPELFREPLTTKLVYSSNGNDGVREPQAAAG